MGHRAQTCRWGRVVPVRALIVAAVALCLGPACAGAKPTNGYKAIFGPLTFNGAPVFPVYHDLGVKIYQDDLNWADTAGSRPRQPQNPNDPAYVWPQEVSQAVAQARRYRMRVLLVVYGTPAWANGGRTTNWAPNRPGDFADFLTAASRHYRGVHLWMIWVEPNRYQNFMPLYPASSPFARLTPRQKTGPHTYARLLDASYGALKKVSKSNLVIGGDTYTTGLMAPGQWMSPYQWIKNLRLPNGKPPRIDLYGHNPFSFRAPNLASPPSPFNEVDFSDLPRFARAVDRNLGRKGNRHPRLYLPEFMVPTALDNELNFFVSRGGQAAWIRDAMRIMRHWRRIYALGWIHVYDDPPADHGTSSGLFDWQGNPKPGYFAYKHG
jgi:hypothetical protein